MNDSDQDGLMGRTALVSGADEPVAHAICAGLEERGTRVLRLAGDPNEGLGPLESSVQEVDILVQIVNGSGGVNPDLFEGAASLLDRVLPSMMQRGYGRILFVIGGADSPADGLAGGLRSAWVGLARTSALKAGGSGVTVNSIELGLSEDRDTGAAPGAELLRRTPLGRAVSFGEIAAGVAFLASSHAGYITGATLPLNGGLGLGLFPEPPS